ncbi:hypothetical protein BHM03_00008536 [Ensete ventricosum]|nr:hypothetical protein BHM03_00008536 [Ensete ventricosum]
MSLHRTLYARRCVMAIKRITLWDQVLINLIFHLYIVYLKKLYIMQKANGVQLKVEDIAVSNVRIDLTRGKHNPLESISFFKVEAVSEAFENLQLKIYGVKTQVHETPEAKKQRRQGVSYM